MDQPQILDEIKKHIQDPDFKTQILKLIGQEFVSSLKSELSNVEQYWNNSVYYTALKQLGLLPNGKFAFVNVGSRDSFSLALSMSGPVAYIGKVGDELYWQKADALIGPL